MTLGPSSVESLARGLVPAPEPGPDRSSRRGPRLARAIPPGLATAALLLASACGRGGGDTTVPSPAASTSRAAAVRFTDVTAQAGLRFRHQTGAFGQKYLPETMGSGCAFLDYDRDGRPDILLANGTAWPGHAPAGEAGRSVSALYRNRGDGTFEDVTRAAGIAVEAYTLGVAIGDYDNDGFPDVFLNALGPDHLFHNRGNGTFEDVTARAGVSDPAFGSSATFVDYDGDGRLDLFVCNYVAWTPGTDLYCTLDGTHKSYCTPESYPGASNRLFRNLGGGRFEDVSKPAGIWNETGKSLGVVVYDHDGDGRPDLAVANDTQPNFLYRNRGDGTFEEIGREAGIAFSESGTARGAMGIDAGDYDEAGRESLVIGNFSNEMVALYHNEGSGLYVDDAPAAGIGPPSLLTLAFGTFFFDFDLDGKLDLFVANGHVEPDIQTVQKDVSYAERPHLFRNLGGGRFEPVPARTSGLDEALVARGAAYADIDGDGDLDILMTTNGGAPCLLRNDGGNTNHWLRARLEGRACARDAFGTAVTLVPGAAEGGPPPGLSRRITRTVRAGASYASQSEPTLTFGMGDATSGTLEVRWPSGRVQSLGKVDAGRTVTIIEGEDHVH